MIWWGWSNVDSLKFAARASTGAVREAAQLASSEARLMVHEAGSLSASQSQAIDFELKGHSCSLRIRGGGSSAIRAKVDWVANTPAHDALAAGEPGQALPVLSLEVADLQGRIISGVMLVVDGLFSPQDIAWALNFRHETNLVQPGLLPVLASDRRPLPRLQPFPIEPSIRPYQVFQCENPSCRGRHQKVLVRTEESAHQLRIGNCIAYPCPSCPGGWSARWALSFVREPVWTDLSLRLPVVSFAIAPTRRRRFPTAGTMTMVQRSDMPTEIGRWVLPAVPPRSLSFVRSRRQTDLLAAIRQDPARTGALMAGLLNPENLRTLIDALRQLPVGKRTRCTATALAFALYPRRPPVYKLEHDAAQESHHPYIAFNPQTFVEKLAYYGVINCTGRFLDIGSGTGEKVFLAYALGRFSQCDGLEFDARTLAIAEFLLHHVSPQDAYPIRHHHADALLFDCYGDYEVIYMYRPMRDSVLMGQLFRRIAAQMKVGAVVFDVYRDDCALRKVGENRFKTCRSHPGTGRARWNVPISLDEFIEAMGFKTA